MYSKLCTNFLVEKTRAWTSKTSWIINHRNSHRTNRGCTTIFKGDSDRSCFNYKEISENVLHSHFLISPVELSLSKLHGSSHFPKVDVSAGFYQIRIFSLMTFIALFELFTIQRDTFLLFLVFQSIFARYFPRYFHIWNELLAILLMY